MAEQIKREVATMKLIKHPNVVRLYEVNHGRMREDEARRYFQQLINAVDYCHSRGVYHRDLKPENLLLDAYGNLKVSDFGLSALSQQVRITNAWANCWELRITPFLSPGLNRVQAFYPRASDRMCSKGAVSQIPLVPLRIPILPGVGCGRRDHHPKVWVPVGSLKGFVMEVMFIWQDDGCFTLPVELQTMLPLRCRQLLDYDFPHVLNDRGYDGATADLWSCGVILFISAAEFTCPPWLSFGAMKLITRILDPNPMTRITIPEILEDEWFKKGYKPPVFEEKGDANLDDVEAVFKDSEEHHVTEKTEEQPAAMNAFELISMSKGLNLGNLFDIEQGFKRETRFTSKCPANEIIHKIEEAVKPLGFDVHKKNYKMRLENMKAGRKGNLNVATEVFQVAPSLHMVEVRKAKGDTPGVP
ncbi:CBL-interacting serine/threonine-protein kinase 3 [Vitis vinifera]|uniref:non-specific serine/threonine protein kinase n=1 Tax=Vitis vinifera TaxID=29760 RepID=A0A438I1Y7_VITVI|nr:CBL-interacting serine/threonine-protein kinase 3 [Vitis vinifera]